MEHDLSVHICAICCRAEVAGDVFSGLNLNSIEGYAVVNFEAKAFCPY